MPKRCRGFTLVELLVTITLVGILAAIAIPSFSTTIQNTKADTEVSDFQRFLNYARQQAINSGTAIRITPAVAGGAWNTQLTAIDPAAPIPILRVLSAMDSGSVLAVSGNPSAIDFNNLGGLAAPVPTPAAALVITYNRGTITRVINICLSGRIVLGGC
ncbi:GspH/FimT family pseudopilin [Pseudomonas petrae]|uniref:Type II secretion system protein H n=1 Tax=Pseudomonas petrae TaxID=2912190 RepID=A0ABS9IDA3_9PSED|nr:GspH/FimT family pseudopilin [Pseudomonas petrae]MCF7537516.1 GspH/FimT family pseudopilin [Pseudomonas petrae]MCF7545712.1 GspH/FimT family pseudopilin [Pseudomonas petrae]